MPSGATGEQLLGISAPAFVMPGDDPLQTYSSAHALRELLPLGKLATLMPAQQNAAKIEHWICESTATRDASASAA